MNYWTRLLFTGLYALGVLFISTDLLDAAGLKTGLSLWWSLAVIRLAACFTGYVRLVPLALLTYRLRKPILEEEEWMHPLLHELILQLGRPLLPEVYILEEP